MFALDTKGSHLEQDMRNKLVRLHQADGRPKVHIRFIVDGRYDSTGLRTGTDSFTVVGFRPDQTLKYRPVTDLTAAAKAATKPTL